MVVAEGLTGAIRQAQEKSVLESIKVGRNKIEIVRICGQNKRGAKLFSQDFRKALK